MQGKLGFLSCLAAYLSCIQTTREPLASSTSLSVQEGRMAALECRLKAEGEHRVSWYKQIPGEKPQFVLTYQPSNGTLVSYGSGFGPVRFAAKGNSSFNSQLVIRNASLGDTALYFCGLSPKDSPHSVTPRTPRKEPGYQNKCWLLWNVHLENRKVVKQADDQWKFKGHSDQKCMCLSSPVWFVIGDKVEGYIIFSEGIQLIVRGPQTSAADPSVTVFPPPQDQLRSSGRATLVCLIRGLSTSMADISWYSNGEVVTKGVIVSPASRDSDGTFSTVSLLTIPALSWEQGHTYSCTATEGDKVAESSVQASRC